MAENEFSDAFSTAYDADAGIPGHTVCYPPGADWSCEYTVDQLAEIEGDPVTLARKERSEALAWMTLSTLTGGQVGTCPVAVRPCLAGCGSPGSWMIAPVDSSGRFAGVRPGVYAFSPHVSSSGAWVNSCGCVSKDCSCTALCEAILPGPVGSIVEVWVDGAILDPSAYRVDNGNRLVRTDAGCWPACQDMTQGKNGEDAFSVTYYQGFAPNALAKWAAGLLAAEYYKACGGGQCRLPQGVQSVTRQGVSYDIRTDFFDDGLTGIREVDAFVRSVNPYGLRSRPIVTSPDAKVSRMTTWGR